MSATLFERARIVDPSRGLDETGSLLVVDGKIAASGADALNQGAPEGATRIDCANKLLIPGLIDSWVFIGEPGGEHRETIASAAEAPTSVDSFAAAASIPAFSASRSSSSPISPVEHTTTSMAPKPSRCATSSAEAWVVWKPAGPV